MQDKSSLGVEARERRVFLTYRIHRYPQRQPKFWADIEVEEGRWINRVDGHSYDQAYFRLWENEARVARRSGERVWLETEGQRRKRLQSLSLGGKRSRSKMVASPHSLSPAPPLGGVGE